MEGTTLYYANFYIAVDLRNCAQLMATAHLIKASIGSNFMLYANKAYYLLSPSGKKLWLEGEKVFSCYLSAWLEMVADPACRSKVSLQEFSLNAFKRTQAYSFVVELAKELISSFYKVAEDSMREALGLLAGEEQRDPAPPKLCFSIEQNKTLVPLVSFGAGAACLCCGDKGAPGPQAGAQPERGRDGGPLESAEHSHLLQDEMEWVHPDALEKLQGLLEKELGKSSTGWQNVNGLAVCIMGIDSSLLKLLPNRPRALQDTRCVGIRIIQPVPAVYQKMLESFVCLHAAGAASLESFQSKLKRAFAAAWKPDLLPCCESFYSLMNSHRGCLDADSPQAVLPSLRAFLARCLGELFERWNLQVVLRSKNLLKSTGTK